MAGKGRSKFRQEYRGNSERRLAYVEQMLEITGAHGEFGMSGGAVLGEDASVRGLLSHEKPDPASKILYAIPIAECAKWALRFARDANALPELIRTSLDLTRWRGVKPCKISRT